MRLRYRKRIKLLPGVRLNLTNRGGSISIGKGGVAVNINNKGIKAAIRIPGTRLSYQTKRFPLKSNLLGRGKR